MGRLKKCRGIYKTPHKEPFSSPYRFFFILLRRRGTAGFMSRNSTPFTSEKRCIILGIFFRFYSTPFLHPEIVEISMFLGGLKLQNAERSRQGGQKIKKKGEIKGGI